MSGLPEDNREPHLGFDEVRFWEIAVNSLKRVVAVHPDHEEAYTREIEVRGLSNLLTVVSNPHMPPDMAYVWDQQAMEAALEEENRLAIWKIRGQWLSEYDNDHPIPPTSP